MKHFKLLTFLVALSLFAIPSLAQVTTSGLTGTIKNSQGEPLVGATVKATHEPSGTIYGTVTQNDGSFNIPGMRIGGPYKVEISFVGYQAVEMTGLQLTLGQPYSINRTLAETGEQLGEVTVVGAASKLNKERTGAATNISQTQLNTLPTISRSITDFTRTTPQANGNNFGGRDGRFNNLQVDGVNLNNNFGLSTDLFPGGGASPISLDALSEISVDIAPYDVRQSGFTGTGINVATKSGTNEFHGTAYAYYRDQDFNGKKVNGQELSVTKQNHKTYGGSVGGPIIKDKLFFFVNGEYEKAAAPGISFVPAGVSGGNQSTTTEADLQKVSDYLESNYGYNTGSFKNFPSFNTKNHKILGKIDWNIDSKHTLSAKYSDFKGSDMSPLNGTSNPNNGTFLPTGRSKPISRLINNRFSSNSMSYANSNYGTDHIVRTASLELNSRFSSKIHNQFIGTYTYINDTRTMPGGLFPTIDIFNGQGDNFISAGTDPFTPNNEVVNKVLNITDNFTYFAGGGHTITGGITYEHQSLGNAFMGGSNSYYIYDKLDDFLNDAPPIYYGLTYGYGGVDKVFSADLKMSQLGVYAQDEYQVNDKLKLTLGIRADMPIFGEEPQGNPAINNLEFPKPNGTGLMHYNTGKWPKTTVMLSPRLGFRWDVDGDKSLILRGGTGIFTGQIPFVFLTNMPSNSGMTQNSVFVSNTTAQSPADLGITFSPDPHHWMDQLPDVYPQEPDVSSAPQSFVLIDPNFKFPQVWRTDLGADKDLGNGFTASVDLMFTKDLQAVRMIDNNLKDPTSEFSGQGDTRPFYPDGLPDDVKFYYPDKGSDILLLNTHKGYSYSGTFELSKSFSDGFYGSVAYTYTKAKEVSPNPGSRATSAWQSIENIASNNVAELGNSNYAVPHRVTANVSYRKEYANHFASTISFFYQGQNQGVYSYTVNGSIVGDGNSGHIMYVYEKGTDVDFVPVLNEDNSIKYTVADQQAAYDEFLSNSKYLKKYKGQYAGRNKARTPWYNEIDMRFLQDFFIESANGTRHNLQLSVDILNLPNLISNKWANFGYRRKFTINNPLNYEGVTSDRIPQFTMREYQGKLATEPYDVNYSNTSVWQMQLGLRYTF